MILRIVPELTEDRIANAGSNVKLLDYKSFNDITIHPFIATREWERVEVELAKGIRGGFLKEVITRINVVKVILCEGVEIDFEIVSRLTEMFPSMSGHLKKAYMQNEDVISLLKEGDVLVG